MLQSVLHKIWSLPTLLDLGQTSHMRDALAMSEDSQDMWLLQPLEANSKIDPCPFLLLNKY